MKKNVGKHLMGDLQSDALVKRMASMFKEVQKQKEYARHNPPMERRTTRFICRLGRGAQAFDSVVSERLPVKAVPLFWQLAFIEAVKSILSSDDSVTISHRDAVMELRYAHNVHNFPLTAYGFRRTASVLALSVRRKVANER